MPIAPPSEAPQPTVEEAPAPAPTPESNIPSIEKDEVEKVIDTMMSLEMANDTTSLSQMVELFSDNVDYFGSACMFRSEVVLAPPTSSGFNP
jgi:hypothetical protein